MSKKCTPLCRPALTTAGCWLSVRYMEVVPHLWPPTISTPGSILVWLVSRPAVTDRRCAARLAGGETDRAIVNHPLELDTAAGRPRPAVAEPTRRRTAHRCLR